MKLLRETIRRLLIESIEFEDKFKILMSSPHTVKQALELAENLGIPSSELPWNLESVSQWIRDFAPKHNLSPSRVPEEELKSATGWDWDRFREEWIKDMEKEGY